MCTKVMHNCSQLLQSPFIFLAVKKLRYNTFYFYVTAKVENKETATFSFAKLGDSINQEKVPASVPTNQIAANAAFITSIQNDRRTNLSRFWHDPVKSCFKPFQNSGISRPNTVANLNTVASSIRRRTGNR